MSIFEKAMNKLGAQAVDPAGRKKHKKPVENESPDILQNTPTEALSDVSKTKPKKITQAEGFSLEELREQNVLISGVQEKRAADEYRRIKRPVLANAFGKNSGLVEQGNLVLVTSSIPGEGKTHTAINLALSIARERNHTVLLVDIDSARAGTSRAFGLDERPGLTDLLVDDRMDLSDILVRRSDIDDLAILPVGQDMTETAELLSSNKMQLLVDEISERYPDRLVIFDAAPVLATSEAQGLINLVGQVLFVVEAVSTPKHIVKQALGMLETNKPLNLVLNKGHRSLGIDYYGGYYVYGR